MTTFQLISLFIFSHGVHAFVTSLINDSMAPSVNQEPVMIISGSITLLSLSALVTSIYLQ